MQEENLISEILKLPVDSLTEVLPSSFFLKIYYEAATMTCKAKSGGYLCLSCGLVMLPQAGK